MAAAGSLESESEREVITKGYINKVVTDRGFGFIKVEGEPDVFLHAKQLHGVPWSDELLNRSVEFGIEHGERGRVAVNVRLID